MAWVRGLAAASKALPATARWPSARQSSLAVPAGTGQSTASGSTSRPEGSSRPFRVSFDRAVAAHGHEAAHALGQGIAGELGRVSGRLGEHRLDRAQALGQLGLDGRPARQRPALAGGRVDDHGNAHDLPFGLLALLP